ncbi:MAG: GDP-L-fucose synthase [Gammaproteobacteria bacterium]|nr:GDP-L-fucose synthase [Gammaproteobacteria bacterium]
MNKTDKIYVAGHRGLVGSAIMQILQNHGYFNLVYRTHKELDLTVQAEVNDFFLKERPDFVFLAAAKVGGIHANNTYRGEFIYQNLMVQVNVIEAARLYGVKRLLFLGSSCIYPRNCPQPMREEYLLSGPLEQTNEPYAVAKIAGVKLCEAYNDQYNTSFVSVMPTNLYGPNDNFDLDTSHVLPALIRKVHEAKLANHSHVVIWGSGIPKREFMHVEDMASACLLVMNQTNFKGIINIGSGEEVSIQELAKLICEVVGYTGNIVYDNTKPDGTLRKLLDTSRLNHLGWKGKIKLREGLRRTYEWFLNERSSFITM